MPRTTVHPPSLPLFGEGELTRDRALALVKKYPVGCSLRQIRRHGKLYWSARTRSSDGGRDIYVGSEANKRRVERAWDLVRAELAQATEEAAPAIRQLELAADATPAIRKLRELQTISGVKGGTWLYAGKGVDEVRMVVGGETRPPK
jgi:hypothetical protein